MNIIDQKSIPEPNSGCWIWLGSVNSWGYGMTRLHKKVKCAHVASWIINRGPIPDGYKVDHLCRNRLCVNPDHLEPVTHKENVRRGLSPWGGILAKKTHCPQGHEYTPENTLLNKNPYNGTLMRQCRSCKREANRRRYYSRKA